MVSSVDAEIAAIEGGNFMSPPSIHHSNSNRPSASGMNREGSIDTFNSKDNEKGDLLVGFPSRLSTAAVSPQQMGGNNNMNISSSLTSSGKAKQRNSVSLNPLAMRGALAGLSDLDDSDDDEDDKQKTKKKAPSPPPAVINPKSSGGPDHRPLVGGFAAAAYEAARVDHYKKQGMDVRGHQAPKPRPQYHFPRYP